MRIIRVQLDNFKCIRRLDLPPRNGNPPLKELPNGLFTIRGPNSSGKTTLEEGIIWGLWGGHTGRGNCGLVSEKNSMVIRDSPRVISCQAKICFMVNDSVYDIEREKHRDQTTKVALYEISGDKRTFLAEGLKDVCDKMRAIVNCTGKDLGDTFYIEQGEVNLFAVMKPADLREKILSLFRLDKLGDEVKEKLERVERDRNNRVGQIEKALTRLEEVEKGLGEYLKEQENDIADLNNTKQYVLEISEKLEGSPDPSSLRVLYEADKKSDELCDIINDIKGQVTKQEENLQEYQNELEDLSSKLEDESKKLEKLFKEMKTFPSSKQIRTIRKKIEEIEQLASDEAAHIDILQKELDSISEKGIEIEPIDNLDDFKSTVLDHHEMVSQKQQTLTDQISKLENAIGEMKNEVSSIRGVREHHIKDLEKLEESDKCLMCLSPMDSEDERKLILGRIETKITDLGNKIKDEVIKLKELKSTLENSKEGKEDLDNNINKLDGILHTISSIIDTQGKLGQSRPILSVILSKFKVKSVPDLLKKFGVECLDDLSNALVKRETESDNKKENVEELHNRHAEKETKIQRQRKDLERIKETLKVRRGDLTEKQDTATGLLEAMKIGDIPSILTKFSRFEADDLLDLKSAVELAKQELTTIKGKVSELEDLINKRKQKIKECQENLEKREPLELDLGNVNKDLTHLDAIKRKYWNMFLSAEVIQNRLFPLLRREISTYLSAFTNGQFTLHEIRTGGRGNLGIEMVLLDNTDGLEKTKEKLSGGDKAVLGLATRLAITNIIARVRPFKTSNMQAIQHHCLFLDEPLASIDSDRRYHILRALQSDPYFQQIFLVTHTNSEYEQSIPCHQIFVGREKNESEYEFRPMV